MITGDEIFPDTGEYPFIPSRAFWTGTLESITPLTNNKSGTVVGVLEVTAVLDSTELYKHKQMSYISKILSEKIFFEKFAALTGTAMCCQYRCIVTAFFY